MLNMMSSLPIVRLSKAIIPIPKKSSPNFCCIFFSKTPVANFYFCFCADIKEEPTE